MERTYHQEEAEQGPLVLERLSDLDEAAERLGDFVDIRGMEVVNHQGDIVGKVEELYIDPKMDIFVLAGIDFGAKRVLVPVDQLEMIDDKISVMTTPELMQGAPEYEEGMDPMAFHDYWCQACNPVLSQQHREQTVTVVEVVDEEE